MLLIAAMSLLAGPYVPIGMKLVGAASLAGVCLIIAAEARLQGASRTLAALLGALPLLLPSMIFQASLGMENMPFAFLVLLFLRAWLASAMRRTIAVAGLPLLFLLRPEAVLLGVCLTGLALVDRDWRNLISLAAGAAIALSVTLLLDGWTGVPFESAGYMRAALSRMDGITLTVLGMQIGLNFKFAPFLLYCLPFAFVAGLESSRIGWMRSEVVIFSTLFCLPLLLHLGTFFPSTHFSRYFLYGYAVLFFLFARAMARVEKSRGAPAGFILAAVAVLAVTLVPYEQFLRRALPRTSVAVAIDELTPEFVRANSDALYAALGRPPAPVVIALREVQMRGRLDGRFVVWPLDGVVDDRMRRFVREGHVDIAGYLAARQVAFIFDRVPEVQGLCLRQLDLSAPSRAAQASVYAVVRIGCPGGSR